MVLDALAVVYVILCLGVMEACVSPHFLVMGVSMSMVGLALGSQPVSYTLTCLFYSRFLYYFSLRSTMTLGLLTAALGTALCAPPAIFPKSPWLVVLGIILIGFGMASTFLPALPHMLEEAHRCGLTSADNSLENVLSAITATAFSTGEMLGPAIGGVALIYTDFELLVQVLGGLGVIIAIFYHVFSHKPIKNELVAQLNE